MKVSGNTYASSPIGRVATVAGAAVHWPFNSSKPTPSLAERIGGFAGGIITPAPGFALGGTGGGRALSVLIAYSYMFVNTTPPLKNAGDPVGTSGLVVGHTHALLIGASYSFGGP
jgi:hypothetical protein